MVFDDHLIETEELLSNLQMSNRQFQKSQSSLWCFALLPSELSTYYTNLPIRDSEKNFAGALHSTNDQLQEFFPRKNSSHHRDAILNNI